MNQPTNQKVFFAVVAIFAIPILFLMIVSSLSNRPSIPAEGRALSFQAIPPQIELERTPYRLDYANQTVVLTHTSTHQSITIVQDYSPVAAPPAYVLLANGYRIYLITRLDSGGNSGANWYKVFSLSESPLVELTSESAPENGLSCVDPYLDDHDFPYRLVFQHSENCAASPNSYQQYSLAIN